MSSRKGTSLFSFKSVRWSSLGLLTILFVLMAPLATRGATVVVRNGEDSGSGSLRWAIDLCNESPETDRIVFRLPSNQTTIYTATTLPAVTSMLHIDATTQPGYDKNRGPAVTVDGARHYDSPGIGLQFLPGAEGASLHGLRVINQNGVGLSTAVQDVALVGNEITKCRGACLLSNGDGTMIQGNVLGECGGGIQIRGTQVVVDNNKVGVSREGTATLPILGNGISTLPSASRVTITNNVIAGCSSRALEHLARNGTIQANFIGTDATGSVLLGNADGIGIGFFSTGNLIGGPERSMGNVVSGSRLSGMAIAGGNNVFWNNLIGVDASGSHPLPNGLQGVQNLGSDNTFAGNVVSGNAGKGMLISHGSSRVVIRGNKIGTSLDGSKAIPNKYEGITVDNAGRVTLGGRGATDGNTIAFNGAGGAVLTSSSTVLMLSNSIYNNTGPGIAKDERSVGLHPMSLVLVAFDGTNVSAVVTCGLPGEYVMQVFSSSACDPTGSGEGQTLVGELVVKLPGLGLPVPVTVGLEQAVAVGMQLTATISSNVTTSGFSECLAHRDARDACLVCVCMRTATGGRIVNCESQGLRSFPDGLPSDTEVLLMGKNPLTHLHVLWRNSDALAKLARLHHLDVHAANLEVLPSGIFRHLAALETLDLSQNRITGLGEIDLHAMPGLKVLHLEGNRIAEVPARYISGSCLISVALQNNRVATVGNYSFGSSSFLQFVNLAGNPIVQMADTAFAGSVNLHSLDLSDNGASDAITPQLEGLPLLISVRWMSHSCPAGFGKGFASSDYTMCLRCGPGTHKGYGQGSLRACTPCAPGTSDHDLDPVTPCLPCDPGHFSESGSTGPCELHLCRAGWHDNDHNASTPCQRCPTGTHAGAGVSGPCPSCPHGTGDLDADPATECEPCSPSTGAGHAGECPGLGVGSSQQAVSDGVVIAAVVCSTVGVLLTVFAAAAYAVSRRRRRRRKSSQQQIRQLKVQVNDELGKLGMLNDRTAAKLLDSLEVPRSHFQLCRGSQANRIIGEGEFGVVRLATLLQRGNPEGGVEVAVKSVHAEQGWREREKFLLGAQLTAVLQSEYVVSVLALCTSEMPFMVGLEYMDGGDLRTYLRKAPVKPDSALLSKVCWQIASALAFLKSKGVVHRDLAAKNVLVQNHLQIVKLAGFGMGNAAGETQYFRPPVVMGKRDSAQFLSWAKDRYARNGPGRVPVEWLAPESLQDKVFTFASDIWALAILMWEVFSFGATPYAGLTAVNTAISIGIGKRLPQPSSCPSMLYSMMLQMWQLDLKARLTIEEVLETLNDHLLLVEACRSELVCSAPVCSDSDNSPVSSPRYSAGSQRSSRCSALPKFSRHSSQLLAIGEEEVPVVAGRSSVNGLVAPDRHRNLGDTPGAEAPVGQPGHKASPHPEHDGASETIAFVEELDSPADTEAPVRPEGTRRKHRKSWTSALKRSAKIRGDQDGATKHRMPRRQRHSMATVAFNEYLECSSTPLVGGDPSAALDQPQEETAEHQPTPTPPWPLIRGRSAPHLSLRMKPGSLIGSASTL